MSDSQGICTFPTLNRITSASFTLSHGITPSSAIVTVDFQAARPAAGGTLSFHFGRTRVNFPGCRINTARGSYSRGRRIQFQIVDRRWKWQANNGGGHITGKYNVRQPDGKIQKGTRKSSQELAGMLLDAMGESGYDVSQMPNGGNPQVDWIAVSPAQELAKLCDALGCRIVLHLDNRVRIHRQGVGAGLPTAGALTHSYGIDPPERPDRVDVYGEETRVQSRLGLLAIGQDLDGEYKPVQLLSYAPPKGWEFENPAIFASLIGKKKETQLAFRDIFRLYEVFEQADGTSKVPGLGIRARSTADLLPLGESKIELDKKQNGRPAPAELFGEFYDDVNQNDRNFIPTFANTKPGTKCPVDFSIDSERGHVRLNEPLFFQKKRGDGFLWEFPDLAIETSYAVINAANNQKYHYTKGRDLPGRSLSTGTRAIRIEGLQRTFVAKYNDRGDKVESVEDSRAAFDDEADFYIDQLAARYTNVETNDVTYAGILPIDLDGLRQQVTWKVGNGPATTQASTNTEHNFAVPSYDRRRQSENLSSLLTRPGSS